MFKKSLVFQAIAAALLIASTAGNIAVAQVAEEEKNDNSITAAQQITIPDGGIVKINGSIVNSGSIGDIDWYSFEAGEGSVLSIDIDNAAIALRTQAGFPGVNTMIALYGPGPDYKVLYQNDDGGQMDESSFSPLDPYIQTVTTSPLGAGVYTIGVTVFGLDGSGQNKVFLDGGTVSTTNISTQRSSGTYELVVSGIKPPEQVQIIGLSVKPDSQERAAFNPKAQGVVPVALLSSPKFDAMQVDTDKLALTFGSEGTEQTLRSCQKHGRDVNHDGLPDLVCMFDVGAAHFKPHETIGTAIGRMKNNGKRFIGRGDLKVVPKSLEDEE